MTAADASSWQGENDEQRGPVGKAFRLSAADSLSLGNALCGFLAVCLLRAINGGFSPSHHFGFEAAAWYWHFVDVVWLFLFAAIYVWGSGGEHVAAAAH